MRNTKLQGDDLIAFLDNIEEAGMAVTRQWHDIWKTALMYVWNEQLQSIKKNPDWDYVVVNYIYPLMMQGIAKLTKNNPKILGRAWNDNDAEYADKWQGVIQYVWEQILDMRTDIIYGLLDAAVFGYAVSKVYWKNKVEWDDNTKQWKGDIRHCLVHPMNFWVDPSATRIKNARYLGIVRKVELDWAISQWPEFEEQLREETKSSADYNHYECGFSYNSLGSSVVYPNQNSNTIKQWMSKVISLIFGNSSNTNTNTTYNTEKSNTQYVWLKETYFKDDYEEHIKIEDYVPEQELIASGRAIVEQGTGRVLWADTGLPILQDEYPKRVIKEYDKPVFPNGRFIVRVGKTILNPNLEDQVYKFSRWPINVLPHYILPHMWQGLNTVEFSRGAQDMLNITIAHLIQHVKVSTDPRLIIEDGTLALGRNGKPRIIKSKAGEIIVVEKGRKDGIGKLESSRLGPEVYTLIDYLKRDIETQQFMHATAQGVQSSNISATEAARLDTNAHDMIAMRSVLVDKWIEGIASVIAENIQAYYDINRKIGIIGTDSQTTIGVMTDTLKKVEWTLEIEPGSTLPFDEERRKADYMAAYKMLSEPVPNPLLEDMLRILNIANRNKVLTKYKQLQVFKEFVQLSMQTVAAMQQLKQGQLPPEQLIVQLQAAKNNIMQQVLALMQQVVAVAQQVNKAG